MRELERKPADIPAAMPVHSGPATISLAASSEQDPVAILGRGRLGRALADALRRGGHPVDGPLSRAERSGCEIVVLCVPDSEIRSAALPFLDRGVVIGHTSGATPIDALGDGHVFGLHPLQTFTETGGSFTGASCAIAGSSARALAVARNLTRSLEMNAFEIDDSQRGRYHAAASLASNFLLTLEAAAEAMAESAGIERPIARRMFGPLVEATVRNWVELGPESALSGPVARGDESTVSAQRSAVAGAHPELLPIWDSLVEQTRALAAVATG